MYFVLLKLKLIFCLLCGKEVLIEFQLQASTDVQGSDLIICFPLMVFCLVDVTLHFRSWEHKNIVSQTRCSFSAIRLVLIIYNNLSSREGELRAMAAGWNGCIWGNDNSLRYRVLIISKKVELQVETVVERLRNTISVLTAY